MNTTMADGASERLDAQIADALFGQPGMSKLDVANRLRQLRGDDSPLLVDAGNPVSLSPAGQGEVTDAMVHAFDDAYRKNWEAQVHAPEGSQELGTFFATRAALTVALAARQPVGQEPTKPIGHDECPVTGLPFYDNMEHPERDLIAMYGGPLDVYSLPELQENDGELRRERYDLDADCWVEGGEPLGYFYSEQQSDATPLAQAVDPADPWRGLYSPELMPKLDGVNLYHTAHPDLPSWPKGEDEERGIGPLITAQGFAMTLVSGEYPDDDGEEVDYCAWLASWTPDAPAGLGWRLVCIQDTEDGPAAFYVRPLALIDNHAGREPNSERNRLTEVPQAGSQAVRP